MARQPIQNIEPVCIECGKMGVMTTGEAIYPHRPDLWSKPFFRCECGAYVGAHPGTEIPLGYPAGPATRRARNDAHAAFDPLWKAKAARDGIGKGKARGLGYAWLSRTLGIEPAACHISHMSAADALRVVAACRKPKP